MDNGALTVLPSMGIAVTASNSKKYDFPWEDTLILAFRDIQWDTTINQYLNAANSKNPLQEFINKKFGLPPSRPPLLAKFDGNAENATGDVITSAQTRFFLLEFKSDRSKTTTESDKFIHHLMSALDPENPDHIPFETLSRAGHFFVYSATKLIDPTEEPSPDAIAFGEGRVLELFASPYVDEIRVNPQNVPFSAQELLDGNIGWAFPDMLAYLKTLTELHRKATGDDSKTGAGKHPMKVAIATQNGLFWPYGDLTDVLAMTRIFGLSNAREFSNVQQSYEDRLAELAPISNDPFLHAALVAEHTQAKARKKRSQDNNLSNGR